VPIEFSTGIHAKNKKSQIPQTPEEAKLFVKGCAVKERDEKNPTISPKVSGG
jgi:hypothetical protein